LKADLVKPTQDEEEWWREKATKAHDYLGSVIKNVRDSLRDSSLAGDFRVQTHISGSGLKSNSQAARGSLIVDTGDNVVKEERKKRSPTVFDYKL